MKKYLIFMFFILLLFVVSCRHPKINSNSNTEGLPIVTSFAFTKDNGIQLLEFNLKEKISDGKVSINGAFIDMWASVYSLKFAVIDRDGVTRIACLCVDLIGEDSSDEEIGTLEGKPLMVSSNSHKTCFFNLSESGFLM
ncbi:MAG: hypothetical protein LBD17_02470 [Endomicrobium sp.]|jgi:hypothetical protein|nr:hypothetical protein [Endomicrobium sp.]